MLRGKIRSLIFVLLYGTTSSFLIQKKGNHSNTDEVTKEIEDYFPYVEHRENFTAYLLNSNVPIMGYHNSAPPDYYDWRDKHVVGPVKDQGHCNACWAFSTAAAIECHLAIYDKKKIQLSEQFLVDCVLYNTSGAPKCGQFGLSKAYGEILSEFGGVLALSDYRPYSGTAETCTYTKPPPVPQPILGYSKVSPNEIAMVIALYVHGPLSAGINAKSMDKYGKHNYIDEPTDCSPRREDMNHAIIIVGYNVYKGNGRTVPYWIIKNSWGTDWGDDGYYYLVRGRNACGIANDVYYPIVPV